uniref:SSD domain-containing protein n=5 Tax=Wuchereria bancrofti TaxID=6293 RepID=A0AAF5PJG3_WUCBA
MNKKGQNSFSQKRRCIWAPLEKPLSDALQKYCHFVARYPVPFIIISVLTTCILSSGIFLKFEIVRGVHYLYTPLQAQWKLEDQIFQDSWASKDHRFYPGKDIFRRKSIYLLILAKDGGNILRMAHTGEFLMLLDWVTNETFTTVDGLQYTYRNICLHYRNDCFEQMHVRFIADIFHRGDQGHFNVTYPLFKSQFSTEAIDLSQTLGGVQKNSKQQIQTAKAWMVLYQLQQNSELSRKLSLDYENSLSNRIEEKNIPFKLLSLYAFHSDIFEMELIKSSVLIAPKFTYTFLLLLIFSILCTFNIITFSIPNCSKLSFVIDWLKSKPLLGFIGVIISFMAIISAIGLLLLLNVPFVDIVMIMPFLSLTVGIDDTFLMLAAWHDTNSNLSVEERIKVSMQHAAVSIAITSVTDITAFLIGSIAPLPAVIYFCYYSAAAIAFNFCYSLSAFVAFLAIFGRLEEACRNNLFYVKTTPLKEYATATRLQKIFNMTGSKCENNSKKVCNNAKMKLCNTELGYRQFIRNYYAPFLACRTIRIIAFILFIIYLLTAVIGIKKLKVGFDVTNLLRTNSSAKKFLELRAEFFNYKMPAIEIAVMKPPDMSQKNDRIRFLKVVEEFENTTCSSGRHTTEFWYFAYKDFISDLGFDAQSWNILQNDKEEFEENLQPFLLASDKYRYDILLRDNGTIQAFRLSTQIVDIPKYSSQLVMQCAEQIRSIAKRYETQYNITTYSLLWQLADQLNVIWPQTLQDLFISVVVIIPISLLVIPQPFCALAIALTVGSIALGIMGFMTFWNVNLDAISMITIAMSVGFSVDFAIHITYSYISQTDNQLNDKNGTLETVGWPILQASISILLGILPLATINLYIVKVCFKTVMLIIVFGTVHALLFLPLFLMQIHAFYLWFKSCRIEK